MPAPVELEWFVSNATIGGTPGTRAKFRTTVIAATITAQLTRLIIAVPMSLFRRRRRLCAVVIRAPVR
ncbi:MAG TPA: hypothetical protein VG244_15515, partial [Acidimicrobiales bacterium]|nr:hypothetical protein [Acidimicrobiales bacterium]